MLKKILIDWVYLSIGCLIAYLLGLGNAESVISLSVFALGVNAYA